MLSTKVKFSHISSGKTKAILGHEVDLSSIYGVDEDGVLGRSHNYGRGGNKSTAQCQPEKEQYLLRQSNTFLNLEQLVNVLSALERWQAAAKEKPRDSGSGSGPWKKWRSLLKDECHLVEQNIKPLLKGWLQNAQDALTFETETEALQLEQIRNSCLPEVLLAYVAVLNYSAHYLSREYLLKALELATAIAAKDSDLTGCFVTTGRMPELMDVLALTSTTMLVAEEYGRSNKKVSAKMALWSGKDSLSTAT
ncbi:MAG: hypothetical protein Q9181_000256 [Wetmoreana brouardii]